MTLGEKIMRLRQKQGLSQEAFGESLGVSRQAVSKWETGQAMPDINKITAMSELFGVSTDSLLKSGESMEENTSCSTQQSNASQNDGASGESFGNSALKRLRNLEYKSKTTVWGLPLVHLKLGHAKGIFAVGLTARGLVTLGFFSIGLFSAGLLSLGLLAIGTLALGALSIGGISVGIFALGGVALGIFTLGGLSIGVYSMGGCAIASKIAFGGYARGYIAIGDKVSGTYTWHVKGGLTDEMRAEIYETIQRELPNTPKFIVNLFR